MKKEVKAVFKLTPQEIDVALYDFYVRKFKSNNISAIFSPQDIKVDFNDFLEVSLTIIEEKELD